MIVDSTFLIDIVRGTLQITKYKMYDLKTTQINAFEILVGAYKTNTVPQILGLLENFDILPLTEKGIHESAIISAKALQQGTPIGQSDCLIAGIARAHNENTIITRNAKHFEHSGLKIIKH